MKAGIATCVGARKHTDKKESISWALIVDRMWRHLEQRVTPFFPPFSKPAAWFKGIIRQLWKRLLPPSEHKPKRQISGADD